MVFLSQGTAMPSDHDSPVGLEVHGYEQTNAGGTPQRQDSDGLQTVAPARRQAPRNKYICSLCGQSFIRGEHLRRHEQSRKSALNRL
jgi:uncharacterized Zn-finger protein